MKIKQIKALTSKICINVSFMSFGWRDPINKVGAMFMTMQGVNPFPARVEFGILNNRAFAEIL